MVKNKEHYLFLWTYSFFLSGFLPIFFFFCIRVKLIEKFRWVHISRAFDHIYRLSSARLKILFMFVMGGIFILLKGHIYIYIYIYIYILVTVTSLQKKGHLLKSAENTLRISSLQAPLHQGPAKLLSMSFILFSSALICLLKDDVNPYICHEKRRVLRVDFCCRVCVNWLDISLYRYMNPHIHTTSKKYLVSLKNFHFPS